MYLCLWLCSRDLSCLEERCEWFSKLPRSFFRRFPGYSIPVLPLVILSFHSISRLPKNFPILLGPSLTRSLVQTIPFFINSIMSSVINGFGFCRIFTVLTGAWFSKQSKNKSLNESSLSSSESLRLTVSHGIWAMSVANWSATRNNVSGGLLR